jgi:hypothetical protein
LPLKAQLVLNRDRFIVEDASVEFPDP